MKLDKLLSVRDGHRRCVENQLERIEQAKESSSMIEFNAILEAITSRAETINSLNEKILELTEVAKVEEEMVSSEEYGLTLEIKLRELRVYNESRNNNIVGEQNACSGRQENNVRIQNDDSGSDARIHNDNVNNANSSTQNVSTFHSNTSLYQRLPKLSLPTFSGDILEWQSFWDAFDSSVHQNPNLTEVQKFSYLRTQLEGSTAQVIQGFALTHANYIQAVDLLRERFGQSHKIIHAYIQALLNLPAPSNTLQSMRNFIDKLEAYIRGLESLGQCQSTYGTLLVPVIIDKLPAEIRKNLAREHGSDNWILETLRKALYRELNIMEAGKTTEVSDSYRATASFFTGARQKTKTGSHMTQRPARETHSNQRQCIYCIEYHHANDCTKVTDVRYRKDILRKKHVCFNCLKNHQVISCRSHFRCLKCKRKHHTSICESSPVSRANIGTSEYAEPTTGNEHTHQTQAAILHSRSESRPDVLLKTAVAQVCSETQYAQAYILFDEGAQRSFISQKLADRLNVKVTGSSVISLASFGDSSQKLRHLDTTTIYLLTDAGNKVPLDVMIVPTIAVPLRHIPQSVTSLPHLRMLKLAHPVINEDSFEISLLIGADQYWNIVGNETIRGNGPTAVSSSIGYLLSGPVQVHESELQSCLAMNVMSTDLDRFWKLESLGINPAEDGDDSTDTLETYKRNCVKFVDGKYEAKLPWKDNHAALPTNYEVTKKRTESLIRKLCREPSILQKYAEIIQEQEMRDFIEKVDENEKIPTQVHYIPHHAVRKNSATTPIRIVYDCSCRESAGKPSLNDCLDSTPPVINDISHIMVRFRLQKYAVSTDIEKAFLNVRLHRKDRDVTRFLWLSDPSNADSPLATYRFKSVLFGATCSPFILSATLLKHLEMNATSWVSRILKRDLYVDNILSSFRAEGDVLRYFRDTRDLMLQGGFNLRSWASNNPRLRAAATEEGVLDKAEVTKVLGMLWYTDTDEIAFPDRTIPITGNVTKRAILQYTSRVYDPLGLLSPLLIRAKLLLQELWKEKLSWDTILPDDIQQKWRQLARDINTVTKMRFPRQIFSSSVTDDKNLAADDKILHVFVDSSIQAYGAVAYLCRNQESQFIMAKSRVAPLKTLSLPKLELMAAVIGARLANHLQQAMEIQEVIFWSDSQIVLHWLNTSKTMKRFVQNRVNEIRNLTRNRKWRYCPTKQNPADLITRGITAV